jgi:ferrous iron transport protein B
MKLSELNTGERGVIVKVLGHGGFRKRIVEMGFIKGKSVEVLLNAPLQDPVKYKIMGYEISLRRDEASMIEVLTLEEAKQLERDNKKQEKQSTLVDNDSDDDEHLTDEQLHDAAMKKRRTINDKESSWLQKQV